VDHLPGSHYTDCPVRIQHGEFVAYLEGCQYRLGKTERGIASAFRALRSVCGEDRLALDEQGDANNALGRTPTIQVVELAKGVL